MDSALSRTDLGHTILRKINTRLYVRMSHSPMLTNDGRDSGALIARNIPERLRESHGLPVRNLLQKIQKGRIQHRLTATGARLHFRNINEIVIGHFYHLLLSASAGIGYPMPNTLAAPSPRCEPIQIPFG